VEHPAARAIFGAMVAAAVGTMIGAAALLVRRQCSNETWLSPVLIASGSVRAVSRGRLVAFAVIAVPQRSLVSSGAAVNVVFYTCSF